MLRLLRDSIWQFIGALLALMALILTILIYFWQLPTRHIRIVEVSSAPLISVNPELAGDITVYFKDRLIINAFSVDLRLENTGNQPIVESDYSAPIIISFPPSAEILSVNYLSLQPANIGLEVSQITSDVSSLRHRAQIQPVLLNPGDSATIRLIVTGNEAATVFTVDGRIVGVNQIEVVTLDQALAQEADATREYNAMTLFVFVIGCVSLLYLSYYLGSLKRSPRKSTPNK